MKKLFLLGIILFSANVIAQVVNPAMLDTSASVRLGKFSLGAYVDAYFSADINEYKSGNRPYFVSSARRKEVNINLAFIDVRYNAERVRLHITPGFGTYMAANYAAEPAELRFLVEANAGVCLSKKHGIWLDAGILGSPYTNESAISKDHLMYSRSLSAEYVPYYLSGFKFTLPVSKKITLYLYGLNGWQKIRVGKESGALGTQLEFKLNDKMLLNWNTFLGNEQSTDDDPKRMRLFTDIYWVYNHKKFSATSCAYIGMQQYADRSKKIWWQTNFIARYRFVPQFSLSGRVELFSDPQQEMIIPNQLFSVYRGNIFSGGLCANIHIDEHALIRFEGRYFNASENIYRNQNSEAINQSIMVVANITAWF
ncbi:MAG: outer membrane beta-barrel protein [Bacteroidia bacterium]